MTVHHIYRRRCANYWQCSSHQGLATQYADVATKGSYDCEVPWAILSPVAHGVEDGPAGSVKSARHVVVPLIGDHRRSRTTFIVAVVVLEVVDAPGRVRPRVDLFVAERAEPARAGVPGTGARANMLSVRAHGGQDAVGGDSRPGAARDSELPRWLETGRVRRGAAEDAP